MAGARAYSVAKVEYVFKANGFRLTAHPGNYGVAGLSGLLDKGLPLSWNEPGHGVVTEPNGTIHWFSRWLTVIVFRNSSVATSALTPRVTAGFRGRPWRVRSNLLLIDASLRAGLWQRAVQALDSLS